MTELERIDKVINDLYSIRDVALSVFGDEGYFALDDSIRSLQKTWSICKRGQEEKLKNAYHTPVNNSKKTIKSSSDRHNELTKVLKAYLNKMGYEDIEGGVDAAADYILQNEDYYNDYDLHLKAKKWFNDTIENYPEDLIPLNSSKEPIKSSLEDRLVPYLEEFEEGYADAINKDSADNGMENVNQDTFFEIFMSDNNLSNDDIQKLKQAVEGIWNETSEE